MRVLRASAFVLRFVFVAPTVLTRRSGAGSSVYGPGGGIGSEPSGERAALTPPTCIVFSQGAWAHAWQSHLLTQPAAFAFSSRSLLSTRAFTSSGSSPARSIASAVERLWIRSARAWV